MKNLSEMTTERLEEILNNLKTSARIIGFASADDSKLMVEIEIELANRK